MGHLKISMRQKVENEIRPLNAYGHMYDVASTIELYYLRTAWYMYILYMQSKRISEMLMWSSYDC